MLPLAGKELALAGVLSLVVGLVGFVYLRFVAVDSPADDAGSSWHDRTETLASEVRRAASDLGGAPRHDSAQRRVVPLASRLKRQARTAPADVDEDVLVGLNALAVDCQRLGMEYSRAEAARTGVFLEDRLTRLRDDAESLERAAAREGSRSGDAPGRDGVPSRSGGDRD
jgi:hypothetical protein